jgi:GntR family transcriptional regulator
MGKIDPTAKLPPYRQVAQILADRIRSGELVAGVRIPTESELMAEFEIGRSTARRAVAWLREAGLIETVATRGSYVLLQAARTYGGPDSTKGTVKLHLST